MASVLCSLDAFQVHVLFLVVSTGAIDFVEKLVSDMTHCVSSAT